MGTTPGHALLTGGGTGGHIFPALSVGEELRRRGWQVSFAGSPHGLEARLVPERGMDFHPLAARPVVGQGLLGKVKAGFTLLKSARQARGLVRRLDARVLVSTGGYVSAPAVVGARLARRPVLLVEPNAGAGLANRTLSRWSQGAAVHYPATVPQLHCPAEVTGVPVRAEFFGRSTLTIRQAVEEPHLLILGGSQGALQLNESLPAILSILAAESFGAGRPEGSLRVTHQCGERHVAAAKLAYGAAGLLAGEGGEGRVTVRVVPFIQDVAAAMDSATLILSRAGALTLAEICAVGRPSLLVPLTAAQGHQGDNAQVLVEAGASVLFEVEDAQRAAAELRGLLSDAEGLVAMAMAAHGLARPDAAKRIADAAERLAGGGA